MTSCPSPSNLQLCLVALILGIASPPLCASEAKVGAKVPLITLGTTRYEVDASRFHAERNYWNPAKEAFPADLQASYNTAKNHLLATKKPTQPIRWFGTRILWQGITTRLPISKERAEADLEEGSWFLCFQFGYMRPDGLDVRPGDYAVVMMLDGTIADQVPER